MAPIPFKANGYRNQLGAWLENYLKKLNNSYNPLHIDDPVRLVGDPGLSESSLSVHDNLLDLSRAYYSYI